jgi:CDP-diacylglycerol--serine O-phosphatidyltransferase
MIRPVFVLPNLVTAGSLFSGLCSIIMSAQGNWRAACLLILLSAILDALDGLVARLTRSASAFGVQFDSLTDVVAFGVAPAFLMYTKLELINSVAELPSWAPRMAIGVCALYTICGAIRLARYNLQADAEEKTHFTGMPIPAAAGTAVSTFMVIEQYIPSEETRALHRALLVLMVVLSYLMVSTYPFPSLKGMRRRLDRSFNGLVTIVFFVCLVVAFKEHLALIAFLMAHGYIVLAVIRVMRQKRALRHYSPGAELGFDVVDDTPEEEDRPRANP